MKYLLAHDLGTSGDKATLFDENGRLLGSCVCSYDVHYFNNNWAEQDPEDWWQAFCKTTAELINRSGIRAEEIAAVSFSGQMMGCTCVDRQGNVLRPAIIWADSRAVAQRDAIAEQISQWDFYKIVGHRNIPSYGVHKMMWVRDNEPEIYRRTYKVLNAKDFVTMRLTGAFLTDYSDANSMACFDINTLTWSEKLVGYAGIDGDKLPEVQPSTYVAGEVTNTAASVTGLRIGTPVVIGGGDGSMANVGAGSIKPGKTYSCMGTSAWITTTTEKPIFDPEMRTVTWAHVIPGLYAPNGTMQTTGGALSWAKDTFCSHEKEMAQKEGRSVYDYINEIAGKSAVGANGVLFLPYLMGERAPRWNNTAKGAFLGLKSENTKGDILRSVMEGATMNLAIILDALRSHVPIDEIMVIGGGAKGELWRRIMADIYGTRITVPTHLEEAGAMGAAVTAGVGIGLFGGFEEIGRFLTVDSIVEPDLKNHEEYRKRRELFDNCYLSLEKFFDTM